MAIIGTFTRTANGNFSGNLKTLTLTAKLQFAAETNKSKDSAPDYRVFLGTLEVGAAWKRTAKESGRTTGRSSSTIPPSRRRSTPAWSRRRTARASTCCGLAATATDRRVERAPPAMAGRLPCTWCLARPAAAGPPRGAPSAQVVGARPPTPRRRCAPRDCRQRPTLDGGPSPAPKRKKPAILQANAGEVTGSRAAATAMDQRKVTNPYATLIDMRSDGRR